MREHRLKRILLLGGSLLAVVILLGACSTKTPTAPVQAGGTVVGLPTAQPTADFESEGAPGDPTLVMFTNLSTNAASFFWDFGDGATSQGESPLHRYAKIGTYTVKLTATNGNLNDTDTQFVAVGTLPAEPTADITVESQDDRTVIFSSGSCAECSYSWDFGDGSRSSDKDPVHTYGRSGTYTVSLTVRNAAGSDTDSLFVTVPADGERPSASFSTTINALTVNFSNTSTNATSYSWDFGDGSTSTEKDPVHTYSKAGTYDVTLTAKNAVGSDTVNNFVTVPSGEPNAGFTFEVNSLSVIFTNTSTGATSYSWDFGDGATSKEKDPVHTYAIGGTYTVSLTAKSADGSDTASQFVTVPPP